MLSIWIVSLAIVFGGEGAAFEEFSWRRGELPDRLMELYDGIVDVALFYFVGHGDELRLALCETPDLGPRRMTTGLAFADVRAALRECDARTKIVILVVPRFRLRRPRVRSTPNPVLPATPQPAEPTTSNR
jgi:hypothetical protein